MMATPLIELKEKLESDITMLISEFQRRPELVGIYVDTVQVVQMDATSIMSRRTACVLRQVKVKLMIP